MKGPPTAGPSDAFAGRTDWLSAFRRYLLVIAAASVVWEVLQLPLYTIWRTGTPREIAIAVLHCTGGDILIGLAALAAALCIVGRPEWPRRGFLPVVIVTILIGLSYTVLSEWLNVSVRQSWAYSDLMPRLPLLGTGLSPVLQWLFVPLLAFAIAGSRLRRNPTHATGTSGNPRAYTEARRW